MWKKIRVKKYNMPDSIEGRLRIEEVPKDSSIWELESLNKDVVNKHAFWEIREGSSAKFWEDRWQQRDKLSEIQTLQETQQKRRGQVWIMLGIIGKMKRTMENGGLGGNQRNGLKI